VQRSVRLSATTSRLLDDLAETTQETRNSLVEQLLAESIRTYRHPLVAFRTGGSGRREPCINGTRLLVRQVICQLRAEKGQIAHVADYLGIPGSHVQAAVSYYADFASEIDADQEWAERVESDERSRWEREQAIIA
jgi:uncharacterized protein (DUF433 family)